MDDESEPQQDRRVGTVIGERYRVLERIAEGGMGTVYRGERLEIPRQVAIKFLHSPLATEGAFKRRFEHEARAMSRLSHPNCVTIIDFGVEDAPYLVMDLVTGRTLQELIEEHGLPTSRALNIGRQILAGLAHAHKQEIVHRDVKPGNVIVSEDVTGTGDHVQILDFGLAKLRDAGVSLDGSRTDVALGTPSYMPPEQVSGERVDACSDVYSAGVVIFEMLAGRKPFDSESTLELLKMQLERPPPPLREVAPDAGLSEELEAVLLKAMAKVPEERYPTASELAVALESTPEARAPAVAPPPTSSLPFAETVQMDALAQPSADGVAPVPAVEGRGRSPRSLRWLARLAALLAVAGIVAVVVILAVSNDGTDDGTGGGGVAQDAASAATKTTAPPAPPDLGAAAVAVHRQHRDLGQQTASRDAGAMPTVPDLGTDEEGSQKQNRELEHVKQLIRSGHTRAAIRALRKLRARHPRAAYYPYLQGHLYFKRRHYSSGIAAYRAAIRRNRKYRRRPALNRNLILALSGSAHRRASTLILRRVGRSALPYLRHAAKRHRNVRVRRRAAWLAKRLTRRRRRGRRGRRGRRR